MDERQSAVDERVELVELTVLQLGNAPIGVDPASVERA